MRPVAEEFLGNYVKVIHDFHSGRHGELTLTQGDIFKVTKVIDKNWLRGRNREDEGNFPMDFVEKITLPSVDTNQKVFAATENFPSQQDGDLEFRKGSIIIGLQEIDSNWWQGKVGGNVGIFPLTHALELEIPKLLRNRSKSVHSSEPLFAQALCDSVAQLDEELGFSAGDIITVTEVIDEDWYQGEVHGRSGMFLASCVQLLNETVDENDNESNDQEHYNHSFLSNNRTNDKELQAGLNNDHYNNLKSEYIKEKRTDDLNNKGTYSDEFHRERSISYTSENTKSHNEHDAGVTPYARTLYPFEGELTDELSFDANDIVTLIQHVDEQWIEGELDGKIGLFPANYVEIVVDCPYAYPDNDSVTEIPHSESQTSFDLGCISENAQLDCQVGDLQADSSIVTDAKQILADENEANENVADIGEHFALVLHPFDAETSQDLSVSEGETVTVIRQIDDNWILVENEHGSRGMCPVSFVDIIGIIPEFTHRALDHNDSDKKSKDETANNPSMKITVSESKNESKVSSRVNEVNEKYDTVKRDYNEPRSSEHSGAIKTSQSLDSVSTLSANPVKEIIAKPPLKPKPQLAPKPTLPKPLLGPKPFKIMTQKSAEPSISLPKSESSSSLSGFEAQKTHDAQTSNLTKASSMFEISKSEVDPHQEEIKSGLVDNGTSLQVSTSCTGSANSLTGTYTGSANSLTGTYTGSANSLTGTDTTLPRSQTQSTEPKKAFESWDTSQPIENFIQQEFLKAAESPSRTGSVRSSSSGDSMQRSDSFGSSVKADKSRSTSKSGKRPVSWAVGSSSVNMSPPRPKGNPNYCRSNFYGDSDISVGNSTFFVNDSVPNLRQPPSPNRTSDNKENEMYRKPSLRKPAPPRPKGPRIAPVPSRTPLTPVKAESKLAPVRTAPPLPQQTPTRPTGRPRKHVRPAPPRPQAGKPVPIKKPAKNQEPADNLMSFSPTNTSVDAADTVTADSEAVVELKSRIAEMEKDLENCKKSKEELEQMEKNVEVGEKDEIHENIQFYIDNIQGISNELDVLKDNLSHLCPKEMDKIAQEKAEQHRKMEEERKREEMKKKLEEKKKERKEKRGKVIEEIVQTEKDFITSMNLIMETFLGPTTEKNAEVDLEQLFGNIEEVADVSQRLLTKLEEALNGKDFDHQVLGTCFSSLAEDLKNVYAPYCRNHDDVITLIEKYNQNSEIKEYIEKLLDELREKHVVFDLEALLIKPVQRILKYPLLLNALFKATEDNHPDKDKILQAINAMTDVATAINEYKRRKDLVFKYKKDTDASLGDKLSKLSLHSIKKKSSRIRERFSVNLGFIDQTRDENFDKEETRYRSLEKVVRVFVKDVQMYIDQVTEIVNSQECMVADIEDYFAEKRGSPELQKYQTSHNRVQGTFLQDFRAEVDELVLVPLTTLMLRFEAPNKVIQKRYDKLLDYDNLSRKAKDDKVTEKAVQTAKQDYEALNAQLLDELPKMYQLAFQLFRDCVGSLVQAQKLFTSKIVNEMYSLMELQVLSKDSVIEVFNIKHVTIIDRLAMLSFMPKGFSPRVAEQKAEKKSKKSIEPQKSSEVLPQAEGQKIFVTQQYPANKLYRVAKTYIALDVMDISLSEGDVVGVVIEKDPMGNKDRWFVDTGAQKGFVPKKVLTYYDPTPPRNPEPVQHPSYPVSPTSTQSFDAYDSISPGTSQYLAPQSIWYQSSDNSMKQSVDSGVYSTIQSGVYGMNQSTASGQADRTSTGSYQSGVYGMNQSTGSGQADRTSTGSYQSGVYGMNQSTGSGQADRTSTGSYQSVTNSAIFHKLQEDDMDFALDEDMAPSVPDQADSSGYNNPAFYGEEDELELYYAEYPFTARSGNEVSLFEHQVVTVLHKHDQEGNLEWWYVDADGTFGYAPATYLRKMDTTHGGPS